MKGRKCSFVFLYFNIDFGRAFTHNFRLWIQRNYFEIVVPVEMLWDPVFRPIWDDLSEIFMIEMIEMLLLHVQMGHR